MACQVFEHGLLFMGFSNRLDREGERGQSHDLSEKKAKEESLPGLTVGVELLAE